MRGSPGDWHESVSVDARIAGLLEGFYRHLEGRIFPDDLLSVLRREEGVHEKERNVCLVPGNTSQSVTVTASPPAYVLLRCSRCWTVRSSEVRLSLTGMVEVGPVQPRGVAREPFSLTTTSLSNICFMSAGCEHEVRSA